MANQVIKDNRGVRIGEIVESAGNIQIRNDRCQVLGHYNPRTDTTYDASNRPFGKGNLIMMLLR